ncbi:Hypothetical predicted protein [Mytilus galloprovincialis]|uniref:Uncharacterized protein n=1 Tax=Mytilus galloprovincialis TaxID=29158 RepID=A0A8B6F4P9_MYTGA|nr:Hypothetical predicted protein [Mytilus galloprovincialis]
MEDTQAILALPIEFIEGTHALPNEIIKMIRRCHADFKKKQQTAEIAYSIRLVTNIIHHGSKTSINKTGISPSLVKKMVIQLLNILFVMFRFMSIHRRWGPADFRMERIVDKLAMKEELSDIIKFSINNDWDLQGHDTNLKPSRIKKIVNHLATGLPDHHYQL